jgi:hypothetical protein
MSEKKSLTEMLRTMDPSIIYALLFIVIIIPSLFPLGLPVVVSPSTISVYNVIDKLEPGSPIWFGIDFAGLDAPELLSAVISISRHCLSKNLKIMYITFVADGPMIYEKAMNSLKSELVGKTYGEDYVFMGFFPGVETAIAAIAGDIRGAINNDYYGTPIDSLPMLENIENVEDFDLVFVTGGIIVQEGYIRQVSVRFGKELAFATVGVNYPHLLPYFPEQVAGVLNGLKGVAEYEKLTESPGQATAAVDAFSTSQALLVLLIIVGNIIYFTERGKSRGGS